MSNFNINVSTASGDTCISTAQDILNLVQEYASVDFSDNYALFNFSASTPSIDQQDRPWIKLNTDGTLNDIYVYQAGAWRTNERFSKGDIIMCTGLATDIVIPWAPCDGGAAIHGVTIPDLRDRFIVGAGTTYAVADVGGEASHTLTVDEEAPHTHSFAYEGVTLYSSGSGGTYTQGSGGGTSKTQITTSAGSGGAHENRPPYYALLFKIYVGYL